MPSKDIERRRAASRRHYQTHAPQVKARAIAFRQEHRRRISKMLRELKEATPCADCAKNFRYYVMQFDHVRGDKLFNLANFRGTYMSMRKVLAEVAKCDIVCANCHAERTHQRGQRFAVRLTPLPDADQDGLW